MSVDHPAVVVLPSNRKLGAWPSHTPLDTLNWPLGQPTRLQGKQLRHLRPTDHLILYPRTTSYFRPSFGTRAKISVMVVEPAVVQQRHLDKLKTFYWRFHRVLTANEDLANGIPNGVLFPFGGTWVPEWRKVDVTKTKMTSLIATAKRTQPGHFPRHEIIDWARAENQDIEAIGRGYMPFDKKSEGLAPYRFSIVIENSRELNYFTEKLIDSILCEAVPIYLGCPNIDRYLDTTGMIICNNTDDIRTAVKSLSQTKFDKLLPHIRKIKEKAAHWGATEERAARAVL